MEKLEFAIGWLSEMTGFRQCAVLVALLLTAAPARAQRELRPDYHPVVAGLDYAHVQMKSWDKDEPWSIHIARLERARKDLHVAEMLAHNQVFGVAPISALAQSVPKTTGLPLAAINTGFCINRKDPYRGAPRGLVIMEGQLISPPFRHSFWVNEDGGMAFGQVESKLTATLPGGKRFLIGLNHECKPDKVMLFTHRLGKSTHAANHLELVLEDPAHRPLSWRAGQHYSLRVRSVNHTGNTALSEDIAVLSFGKVAAESVGNPGPGDEVELELATQPDLSQAITASECIFPLIRNGEELKEFDSGKYMLQRHPRTAIGFNTRYFYMVVVDGRQKGLSVGMYPEELAHLMALLGCSEAMNLDGGGSSTFWLAGRTRNSPAGSRERSRSDGLVVVKSAAK